jgi:hypothetical protein
MKKKKLTITEQLRQLQRKHNAINVELQNAKLSMQEISDTLQWEMKRHAETHKQLDIAMARNAALDAERLQYMGAREALSAIIAKLVAE